MSRKKSNNLIHLKPPFAFHTPKCIKQHSENLPPEIMSEMTLILHRYNKVRNYVFSRFSGVKSLHHFDYPRAIRDEWVKTKFWKGWRLPADYWKAAFEDAFATLNANWEATKTEIIKHVSRHPELSADEKSYIY